MLVRYSCRVNAIDWIALTKLDILTGIDSLKVCVEYKNMLTDKKTREFPQTLEELYDCEPVYEEMPGWTEKEWKTGELTPKPKAYVKKLEELCGTPIKIVSICPSREETIILK